MTHTQGVWFPTLRHQLHLTLTLLMKAIYGSEIQTTPFSKRNHAESECVGNYDSVHWSIAVCQSVCVCLCGWVHPSIAFQCVVFCPFTAVDSHVIAQSYQWSCSSLETTSQYTINLLTLMVFYLQLNILATNKQTMYVRTIVMRLFLRISSDDILRVKIRFELERSRVLLPFLLRKPFKQERLTIDLMNP